MGGWMGLGYRYYWVESVGGPVGGVGWRREDPMEMRPKVEFSAV